MRMILLDIHPLCGVFRAFSLSNIYNNVLWISFFSDIRDKVFETKKLELFRLKISFSVVSLSIPFKIYST